MWDMSMLFLGGYLMHFSHSSVYLWMHRKVSLLHWDISAWLNKVSLSFHRAIWLCRMMFVRKSWEYHVTLAVSADWVILVNCHVANELATFRHGFWKLSEHSNFPCVHLFYNVPVRKYNVHNLLGIWKVVFCNLTLPSSDLQILRTQTRKDTVHVRSCLRNYADLPYRLLAN